MGEKIVEKPGNRTMSIERLTDPGPKGAKGAFCVAKTPDPLGVSALYSGMRIELPTGANDL